VALIRKACSSNKDLIAKYEEFALRSFIDDNRKVAWCTGGGCENAIYCRIERGADDALDVMCQCGTSFCFNCKEEAHRPVRAPPARLFLGVGGRGGVSEQAALCKMHRNVGRMWNVVEMCRNAASTEWCRGWCSMVDSSTRANSPRGMGTSRRNRTCGPLV
jgi:hypothetical protein